MAYTAIYANGSTFNMVKKFVIDSLNEIYEIDTSQLSPGSIVLDISSSKTYMLNNKKQWIEVQVNTGADGKDGKDGADGYTPVYGLDYGTPEQIAEISNQAAGILQPDVNQIKDDLVRLENLLIQIQDKINQGTVVDNITVNEINNMIVEYFENKTVSEVEK